MTFFVKIWGTRGSIPTPGPATRRFGGETSCVEVRSGDTLFVCDGGTGLRKMGLDLIERSDAPLTTHMFFSHAHWDHIQGFPFFPPAYVESTTIYVYCVPDGRFDFHELLSGQMDSRYFPVNFSDIDAHVGLRELRQGTEVDGVEVRYLELQHPGASLGYAFIKDGFKVVYATDNELDLTLLNKPEVEADLEVPRLIPQAYLEFVRGADLLIADGQYTDDDYPERVGWGHSRASTLADVAVQAQVKKLAIYHHDPLQSDDLVDRKVEHACRRAKDLGGHEPEIFGAHEGMEIEISRS